jgi:hypothetical protein
MWISFTPVDRALYPLQNMSPRGSHQMNIKKAFLFPTKDFKNTALFWRGPN